MLRWRSALRSKESVAPPPQRWRRVALPPQGSAPRCCSNRQLSSSSSSSSSSSAPSTPAGVISHEFVDPRPLGLRLSEARVVAGTLPSPSAAPASPATETVVIVSEVVPGSPASEVAGLRPGLRLAAIDGAPLAGDEPLGAVLRRISPRPVQLLFTEGGEGGGSGSVTGASDSQQQQQHKQAEVAAALSWEPARFGGAELVAGVDGEVGDVHEWEGRLRLALVELRAAGRRGVWLRVPVAHSAVCAAAARHGFAFHHAQEDTAVMLRWLPGEAEPNPVPEFATHIVGVGGLVLNRKHVRVPLHVPSWSFGLGFPYAAAVLVTRFVQERATDRHAGGAVCPRGTPASRGHVEAAGGVDGPR
jgi:hypothetical protein